MATQTASAPDCACVGRSSARSLLRSLSLSWSCGSATAKNLQALVGYGAPGGRRLKSSGPTFVPATFGRSRRHRGGALLRRTFRKAPHAPQTALLPASLRSLSLRPYARRARTSAFVPSASTVGLRPPLMERLRSCPPLSKCQGRWQFLIKTVFNTNFITKRHEIQNHIQPIYP